MVDTALKSLNLVFFLNEILGTIGVPCVVVQCHLWVRWVCFSLIFVFDWNCFFWLPWVPPWYPKIFLPKSMICGLSNTVSHVWFGYLGVSARAFEVSSFLRIFQAKIHIFVCTMKLNKIMNVSSFVSFDLGKLLRWSTRHWKAQILYFLFFKIWVPLGYYT